ncbi:MAG: RsmB/NOP family class I SAM-dependent RNA methyltransferase [Leadbetterella sp.]|nr:RsmB/NOP family class I SAM-dependent RNA methyltransferase [Leadbetterella sp.]
MNLPEKFSINLRTILGDSYEEFGKALQKESPVSIRLNPARRFKPSFPLNEPVPWTSQGYYLDSRPVFTLDPAYHAGAYYVQEASSMIIEHIVKSHAPAGSPLKVLDLCAAPGGKTTHLASLLSENDLLVANEVIKSRVGILKENLVKWGFPNIITVNQDPETFADLEGFFDIVLVDAPCSGEGMFRKTPDAINEWSEENVITCSARQKRILSAAAMLVAPDGLLIYSTCTYNAAENQENALWLTRTLDFAPLEMNVPEDWGIVQGNPGLQFFPHRVKGEGLYVAAFRNKSRDERYLKGKPNIPRLPRRQVEQLAAWIRPEAYENFDYFLKNDGVVVAIKQSLLNETGSVLRALQKRSSGLELGHFKGNDFVPSHALALSGMVSENIQRIDLPEKDALLYLKKETFELPEHQNGWTLITYQDLPLGWAKAIGDRVNNYLPTEWRIRMKLEE